MPKPPAAASLVLSLALILGPSPVPAADRETAPSDPRPTAVADARLSETLTALEKRSWEAWKNRDAKFFQEFLSDDHVEVGFSGVADKATVVAGVGSPVCVVKSYSVDRFRLTAFDANTALLTYWAEQDTVCRGKPVPSPVWASSLYVRRDGKWWNAAYQQSQAARPEGKP